MTKMMVVCLVLVSLVFVSCATVSEKGNHSDAPVQVEKTGKPSKPAIDKPEGEGNKLGKLQPENAADPQPKPGKLEGGSKDTEPKVVETCLLCVEEKSQNVEYFDGPLFGVRPGYKSEYNLYNASADEELVKMVESVGFTAPFDFYVYTSEDAVLYFSSKDISLPVKYEFSEGGITIMVDCIPGLYQGYKIDFDVSYENEVYVATTEFAGSNARLEFVENMDYLLD